MPRGSHKEVFNVTPGGVREDLNPATIPDGQYGQSLNWLTRRGKGRPRPGYKAVATVAAADAIIGIGFRGSPNLGNNLIVHTLTAGYHYDGSTVNTITGTWSASTATDLVRITTYVSGGTIYAVRLNEANAMDSWNGTGNFADVAAAPSGRDITALSGYLLVAKRNSDPYAVGWNSLNDIATWPAGNLARLVDTPGEVIAVKALSPLSAAVYKEDCVYLATLQAAATAFQFQFVDYCPGPLSPAAVIATQGAHYWIGEDLSLYRFDGSRVELVSSALGKTLFETLNFANAAQVHGMVMLRESPELWFWYPSLAEGGVRRGLSFNILTQAVNPHSYPISITASAPWTKLSQLTIDGLDAYASTIDTLDEDFTSLDSMTAPTSSAAIIGDSVGTFHRMGIDHTDNGTPIAWEFESGYRPVGGLDATAELDGIASYWDQGPASVSIQVTVTVSNNLSEDSIDGEAFQVGAFAVDSASVLEYNFLSLRQIGFRTKWVKVKHQGVRSDARLAHHGFAVLCWPRAMV